MSAKRPPLAAAGNTAIRVPARWAGRRATSAADVCGPPNSRVPGLTNPTLAQWLITYLFAFLNASWVVWSMVLVVVTGSPVGGAS